MKFLKLLSWAALGLGLLSLFGCPRSYVRQPRVVVDTVRTPRCYGKLYTYICRHPEGHIKREVIRCRRYGRTVVRRRKWIVRDERCQRGRDDGPPPQDNRREVIP